MKTILISHRGNINSINRNEENTPVYIDKAIAKGYNVEIDIRVINGAIFLGHDTPDTPIDVQWLERRASKLWVHCKNESALSYMQTLGTLNYFWHQEDAHTITSKGFVWSYPGFIIPNISICVVLDQSSFKQGARGYCSDYIEQISSMVD